MLIVVATTNLFTLLIPLVQSGELLIIVRLLTGLAGRIAVAAPFPICRRADARAAPAHLRGDLRDHAGRLVHLAAASRLHARRQSERLPADRPAGDAWAVCRASAETCAQTRHKIPTTVQRNWPRRNSAVNDGSSSRARASFSPSAATVSGSIRRPHRLMIRSTVSTAASGLPLRRYQRGLSGISKYTSNETIGQLETVTEGNA
jgi:hypothetical protein